jgi:hypothetical protein
MELLAVSVVAVGLMVAGLALESVLTRLQVRSSKQSKD